LNFIIRPATAGTHRGAGGFDLAPQVVVICAGLAALLDVAAPVSKAIHTKKAASGSQSRHQLSN